MSLQFNGYEWRYLLFMNNYECSIVLHSLYSYLRFKNVIIWHGIKRDYIEEPIFLQLDSLADLILIVSYLINVFVILITKIKNTQQNIVVNEGLQLNPIVWLIDR